MRTLSLLLCAALTLAPAVSNAESTATAADAPAAAIVLLKDQPAPRSGVLVSEQQMRVYLLQRADLEQAQAQVAARNLALAKASERSWIETHGAWAGLVVGVLVGAGAAVGVVYAVKK